MTTEKISIKPARKKAPSRGGARPGSGRPRGSGTKVKLEDLMLNIELETGRTYGELLAHNYALAIGRWPTSQKSQQWKQMMWWHRNSGLLQKP